MLVKKNADNNTIRIIREKIMNDFIASLIIFFTSLLSLKQDGINIKEHKNLTLPVAQLSIIFCVKPFKVMNRIITQKETAQSRIRIKMKYLPRD